MTRTQRSGGFRPVPAFDYLATFPPEVPKERQLELAARLPGQPRDVTAELPGIGIVTATHGLSPSMYVVGSAGHHLPDRFSARIQPIAGSMTVDLELACEGTAHAPTIAIGVEGVRLRRGPDHDALTTRSIRITLQTYATAAADLISYVELADDLGMRWLAPRYVNEPMARLIALSWRPELQPVRHPTITLSPREEQSPGLYCLDTSSFVRAYRAQPRPSRGQPGRRKAIPDATLPRIASLFNEARQNHRPAIAHIKSAGIHASDRTIQRAVHDARQQGLIPPIGGRHDHGGG